MNHHTSGIHSGKFQLLEIFVEPHNKRDKATGMFFPWRPFDRLEWTPLSTILRIGSNQWSQKTKEVVKWKSSDLANYIKLCSRWFPLFDCGPCVVAKTINNVCKGDREDVTAAWSFERYMHAGQPGCLEGKRRECIYCADLHPSGSLDCLRSSTTSCMFESVLIS